MQHKELDFEFKSITDAGEFEGYASVFGNVDGGGDVVMPGAFKQIVKNSDGRVVVLLQHDYNTPIGTAAVVQDTKGLHFTGQLVMGDPQARTVHEHMRAKTLTGMSIGYDVLDGGAEMSPLGVRKLTALKLYEI